jgi:predicted DNA-binding protein
MNDKITKEESLRRTETENIRIARNLKERLERHCAQTDQSLCVVLNEAIRRYLCAHLDVCETREAEESG